MSVKFSRSGVNFDADENLQIEIVTPEPAKNNRLTRIFPFGFSSEFRKLCQLALPIMITNLATNTIGIFSVIICGQIGKTELAASGLAISVFNVTGLATIYGLLTACDTLFSQTFGGRNKKLMGIHLQRAIFIISFCCLPCWAVHLVMEPILLSMKHNPIIAKLVGEYMLFLLPALLFAAIYSVLTKYVQTQNIVIAPLVIGVIGNATNAGLHYLLIYHTNIGLKGSAISQSLCYFAEVIMMLIYLAVWKVYVTTWSGYSKEMWLDWGTWFKLACPGLMMLGLQWWIFEIGTILTGIVGEVELATQTILLNLDSLIFTLIPLGLGIGACIRVGQALGAGNALGPISTTSVSLVTLNIGTITVAILLIALRFHLPKIFTKDEIVIEAAAKLLPFLALFIIFDGVTGVLGGVIRGAGMQIVGATTVFVSFYLVSAPIGISLLLITHWKLIGLWIGFICGIIIAATIYLVVCFKIDWKNQVELAAKRTTFYDIVENNEDDITKTDQSIAPIGLKAKTIFVRGIFVCAMIVILLTGILLRYFVTWNKVFGNYCVHSNGTFTQFLFEDVAGIEEFANSTSCDIFRI